MGQALRIRGICRFAGPQGPADKRAAHQQLAGATRGKGDAPGVSRRRAPPPLAQEVGDQCPDSTASVFLRRQSLGEHPESELTVCPRDPGKSSVRRSLPLTHAGAQPERASLPEFGRRLRPECGEDPGGHGGGREAQGRGGRWEDDGRIGNQDRQHAGTGERAAGLVTRWGARQTARILIIKTVATTEEVRSAPASAASRSRRWVRSPAPSRGVPP
jgi:hypothetical protein